VTKRAVPRGGLTERFELKAQAGAGGMGIVYQAIDRRSGRSVAVKILNVKSVTDVGRFSEEATLLQELRHPGIVRYVDHGLTSHGDPYIAMEWLEGETLEQRLARGRLAAPGVAHLAAHLLDALAAAHDRGVVHRDIKPSNVFLVGWRLFDVRIIDFGVARRVVGARELTRKGSTVGTPHYSAPEQARGELDIDGRADIFSVGAVLFECLTGRTPFSGKTAQEVLTNVCLTPVPRVWEQCPGLDPELGAVIDRMLLQDRDRRPDNARDLAGHLREIATRLGAAEEAAHATPDDTRPPAALSMAEQQVTCGLLVAAPRAAATTLSPMEGLAERERFTSLRLPGGSYLLTPAAGGLAVDQIADAARVAARVLAEQPQACVGVAIGHLSLAGRTPAGGLVDRLLALGASESGRVRLHENVARLLPPAQVVRESPISHGPSWLRLDESGELTELAPSEHQGPLLGREYELGFLDQALAKCASARSARSVLCVADPGMGKTRLARAFVAEVRSRGKGAIYFLRGRRQHADTPGGLLRALLPFADPSKGSAPPATGSVGASPPPPTRSLSVPGESRPLPRPVSTESAAALTEWLAAHPARHPVVFVCDDLQWADRASLRLLAAAQHELARRPIMMVCFARPELEGELEGIWRENRLERMRLPPLARSAGQELLRSYAGRVSPEAEEYVFDRWEGNPFFLMELAASFRDGALLAPDAVLGVVEARLLRLDPEARRVLRAASLCGDSFDFEAVLALLGLKGRVSLGNTLEALVASHLLGRASQVSSTYSFRRKLLREAAFATLTVADRDAGVVRARQWLEEAGRTLPQLLHATARRLHPGRRPAAPPPTL
jgi:eukaryotic-like serine/threonine-protein kinase